MPQSELETLLVTSDYNIRKYLLDLLKYKKQINEELEGDRDSLSVEREVQLEQALEIIEENINRIRMDGLL